MPTLFPFPKTTPPKKYAVALLCDQTWAYITSSGAVTIKYKEAQLHSTRDAAETVRLKLAADDGWIEEVLDEKEWRSRPDTW